MYARPKRFIKPKIMLKKSKLKTILIFVFQQIHFVFGQFLTAVLASQIVSSMILDGIWIKVKRMSSNISFRTDFSKVYETVCLVKDFWPAPSLLYLWWATSINKTTSFTFLALLNISHRFDHSVVFEEDACIEQVTCISNALGAQWVVR